MTPDDTLPDWTLAAAREIGRHACQNSYWPEFPVSAYRGMAEIIARHAAEFASTIRQRDEVLRKIQLLEQRQRDRERFSRIAEAQGRPRICRWLHLWLWKGWAVLLSPLLL